MENGMPDRIMQSLWPESPWTPDSNIFICQSVLNFAEVRKVFSVVIGAKRITIFVRKSSFEFFHFEDSGTLQSLGQQPVFSNVHDCDVLYSNFSSSLLWKRPDGVRSSPLLVTISDSGCLSVLDLWESSPNKFRLIPITSVRIGPLGAAPSLPIHRVRTSPSGDLIACSGLENLLCIAPVYDADKPISEVLQVFLPNVRIDTFEFLGASIRLTQDPTRETTNPPVLAEPSLSQRHTAVAYLAISFSFPSTNQCRLCIIEIRLPQPHCRLHVSLYLHPYLPPAKSSGNLIRLTSHLSHRAVVGSFLVFFGDQVVLLNALDALRYPFVPNATTFAAMETEAQAMHVAGSSAEALSRAHALCIERCTCRSVSSTFLSAPAAAMVSSTWIDHQLICANAAGDIFLVRLQRAFVDSAPTSALYDIESRYSSFLQRAIDAREFATGFELIPVGAAYPARFIASCCRAAQEEELEYALPSNPSIENSRDALLQRDAAQTNMLISVGFDTDLCVFAVHAQALQQLAQFGKNALSADIVKEKDASMEKSGFFAGNVIPSRGPILFLKQSVPSLSCVVDFDVGDLSGDGREQLWVASGLGDRGRLSMLECGITAQSVASLPSEADVAMNAIGVVSPRSHHVSSSQLSSALQLVQPTSQSHIVKSVVSALPGTEFGGVVGLFTLKPSRASLASNVLIVFSFVGATRIMRPNMEGVLEDVSEASGFDLNQRTLACACLGPADYFLQVTPISVRVIRFVFEKQVTLSSLFSGRRDDRVPSVDSMDCEYDSSQPAVGRGSVLRELSLFELGFSFLHLCISHAFIADGEYCLLAVPDNSASSSGTVLLLLRLTAGLEPVVVAELGRTRIGEALSCILLVPVHASVGEATLVSFAGSHDSKLVVHAWMIGADNSGVVGNVACAIGDLLLTQYIRDDIAIAESLAFLPVPPLSQGFERALPLLVVGVRDGSLLRFGIELQQGVALKPSNRSDIPKCKIAFFGLHSLGRLPVKLVPSAAWGALSGDAPILALCDGMSELQRSRANSIIIKPICFPQMMQAAYLSISICPDGVVGISSVDHRLHLISLKRDPLCITSIPLRRTPRRVRLHHDTQMLIVVTESDEHTSGAGTGTSRLGNVASAETKEPADHPVAMERNEPTLIRSTLRLLDPRKQRVVCKHELPPNEQILSICSWPLTRVVKVGDNPASSDAAGVQAANIATTRAVTMEYICVGTAIHDLTQGSLIDSAAVAAATKGRILVFLACTDTALRKYSQSPSANEEKEREHKMGGIDQPRLVCVSELRLPGAVRALTPFMRKYIVASAQNKFFLIGHAFIGNKVPFKSFAEFLERPFRLLFHHQQCTRFAIKSFSTFGRTSHDVAAAPSSEEKILLVTDSKDGSLLYECHTIESEKKPPNISAGLAQGLLRKPEEPVPDIVQVEQKSEDVGDHFGRVEEVLHPWRSVSSETSAGGKASSHSSKKIAFDFRLLSRDVLPRDSRDSLLLAGSSESSSGDRRVLGVDVAGNLYSLRELHASECPEGFIRQGNFSVRESVIRLCRGSLIPSYYSALAVDSAESGLSRKERFMLLTASGSIITISHVPPADCAVLLELQKRLSRHFLTGPALGGSFEVFRSALEVNRWFIDADLLTVFFNVQEAITSEFLKNWPESIRHPDGSLPNLYSVYSLLDRFINRNLAM